jgi:hypothetical protein
VTGGGAGASGRPTAGGRVTMAAGRRGPLVPSHGPQRRRGPVRLGAARSPPTQAAVHHRRHARRPVRPVERGTSPADRLRAPLLIIAGEAPALVLPPAAAGTQIVPTRAARTRARGDPRPGPFLASSRPAPRPRQERPHDERRSEHEDDVRRDRLVIVAPVVSARPSVGSPQPGG